MENIKYQISGLKKSFNENKVVFLSYALVCLASLITIIITITIYNNTKGILELRLKERLKSIVTTAAIQFDPIELNKIQDRSAINNDVYKNTIHQLQLIRENNENIRYVYLLRPTDDKTVFTFIADADSVNPDEVRDYSLDGKIDEDDELSAPGDEYDASDFPALINDAVNFPSTDYELTIDQWGTFLSAYSPIKQKGETIAVLGIDVEVSQYEKVISDAFIPFLLFILFLLLLLLLLTQLLVRIWKSQLILLKELDKQKDELLSIVSHQLATPVSSFKWYLEMLLDGDLGELSKEQKEHIKTMQGIGGNLSDLVSMILDVSRIQLGRMRVEKQSLDLNEFFKEIIEIIQPKAIQKNLNFKKKLPSKLPANAILDRRYTHMTIENLLSNAVKYTPEKGTVTFNVEIKNNRMLCVVKDTGMGIPKSEQDKIFGRMFRASNVRNTVDGNGFGLFVAKGAVEAQGGKIWFESTEGKGTTFYVDLPLFEK